ncbi:bifunctional protein STORR-like isoform X3 [Arachis ipaensis]|uniref:bifunctional protein STORR-like isoform X3 n=1 Tax=Arachis ipaensis TaxID=130454 RepID=UPI0007AF8810|nr:bifunctional protein STORR-like isoform X3 [Arachis ipaensis]XP_025654622.1 bifunctional protein STORR isoform X3 [Arachis hypogaea]
MAPNRLWEKPLLKPLNLVSQAPGMNFSSLLSYGYLITIPILFFLLYGVWTSLEQCHKLGLAKSIGVSNFSINKLQHFLSFATILLAVSQIDLKHIFCKMFVRSTQKNCQTMKRRSKASLKSIFTPTKRSAIVLLEVGLREKVATALSAPSATKHWEHLQLC